MREGYGRIKRNYHIEKKKRERKGKGRCYNVRKLNGGREKRTEKEDNSFTRTRDKI